jgi:histidinol dehydrogenase
MDLLSQGEHDPIAQAILLLRLTPSRNVHSAIKSHLTTLPAEIVNASLIIVVL